MNVIICCPDIFMLYFVMKKVAQPQVDCSKSFKKLKKTEKIHNEFGNIHRPARGKYTKKHKRIIDIEDWKSYNEVKEAKTIHP